MTKQQIPSEFQDSSLTSQRLVVGEELLRQATNNEVGALRIDDFRDGRVAAKPVSYYANSNPSSSSISVMTFSSRSTVGEDGSEVKKTEIDSKENFTAGVASSDTLFSADSMTKMITAAAMLRMSEEEKYQILLPNGIETKLSDILPILKEHYPHSNYLQRELETQPNFDQITLQHLAQHTSGLARVSRDASNKKLQEAAGGKLTLDAMIDADKLPKSGKYGENIGEYSYNDLGYELLGRIVTAIASETAQSPQKFGDVVNELVIDEVRKKVGPEESATLKFFTSDQMEINENGKTQVKGHPELRVEFGKHYHDQKFSEVPSHTYDLSCGGSYTTAESMSIIALHILSGEQEFSIFKEQETRDVFNSRQVPIPRLTPDGKYKGPGFRVYGFGYESFSIPGYERYRDHGGLGYGSNSNVMVDTKENKAATTMVAFEDLTLPLAYALTNKEKPTSAINLDPILHQKTLELSENYSESQLLEMRNSLEKSYEDFRERFDSIQRQKFSRIDNPQENLKPARNPLSRPLVIFVGESDHGDMSYGSLVEKILIDAEVKGLSTKVFSEFPTQSNKAQEQGGKKEEKLINIPENFEDNKRLLDEKFSKMGDLAGRMALYEQTMEDNGDLTQEQFREKFVDKIDFLEARELFDKQARERDPQQILGVRDDESGFKNGATWGNFYWFGPAVFHSEKIHGDMAQDVRSGLAQESADLIIVVAGSPHLPGLSQQLEDDFKDCQKIVVSNPNTRVPSEAERIHFDATPEALGRIGTLTKFEIDPQNNNRVTVPPAIAAAIESKSELKSVVSAMEQTGIITSGDEGAADEVKRFSGDKKAKEFEDIGSNSKKSWVDRILNSNQSRDDSVIKR